MKLDPEDERTWIPAVESIVASFKEIPNCIDREDLLGAGLLGLARGLYNLDRRFNAKKRKQFLMEGLDIRDYLCYGKGTS